MMQFRHAPSIWADFPELAAGVALIAGLTVAKPGTGQSVGGASLAADRAARFYTAADAHLAGATEADLPPTQAWRRAFARMGLKPTQYRCASEALLRRYRKEGALPAVHPLVDLCNAISMAYAIPVAVLDVDRVTGSIEVRYADGSENYLAFSGETEHPYAGEVIFADEAGNAHARRWTNRQSALSAVSPATTTALIVAEAMHESAAADVADLVATVTAEVTAVWPVTVLSAALTPGEPVFIAATLSY
jgi:DNA/RNA-binding domain of Phe-tRNA-synthetase-like protein